MNLKPVRGNQGRNKPSKIGKRTRTVLLLFAIIVGIGLVLVTYLAATGQLNKDADSLGGKMLSYMTGSSSRPSQNDINTSNVFGAMMGMKEKKDYCALPDNKSFGCSAAASDALIQAGVINQRYLLAQELLNNLKRYAGYKATNRPVSGDLVFFFDASGVSHHVGVVHVNPNGAITVVGNSQAGVVNEQPIGNFTSDTPTYTFYHQGRQ
ncbi:MAG: hypothetical protein Q7S80_02120 [bacterium]|nr:hypothetical protein [bacterium]